MTNLPTPELQAAVERAQEALDYLDADNDDRADEGEQPVEEVEVNAADLRIILAALEKRGKALEFYRDEWIAGGTPSDVEEVWHPSEALYADCGKTARRALTALGGTADV